MLKVLAKNWFWRENVLEIDKRYLVDGGSDGFMFKRRTKQWEKYFESTHTHTRL